MSWSSAGNGELREILQEIMTVTPGIGQTRTLGALHRRVYDCSDGKSEK